MPTDTCACASSTHVLIAEDRSVAADVSVERSAVAVTFHVPGGHLPVSARAGLVAAVFDLPELRHEAHLRMSVPMGDAELLHRLDEHCRSFVTRAAGATCLIDADVSTDTAIDTDGALPTADPTAVPR